MSGDSKSRMEDRIFFPRAQADFVLNKKYRRLARFAELLPVFRKYSEGERRAKSNTVDRYISVIVRFMYWLQEIVHQDLAPANIDKDIVLKYLPLPGIVWLESCGHLRLAGVEVQPAAVEVDCGSEA